MALTVYIKRHTTKPPMSFGLDYRLSLLSGLQGFMPFNECAGSPRMLPTNLLGVRSGTTIPPWLAFQGDHCLKFAPGGDTTQTHTYVDYGTPSNRFASLAKGPMTLMARIWVPASPFIGGLAERNDANSVNAGWEWGLNGTAMQFCVEFSSVNLSASASGTPGIPTGRWVVMAVTYNGPSQTAATAVAFYFDGRFVSIAASANGSGTQGTDATQHLFVGRATFTSGQFGAKGVFPGYISWFAGWNRILSGSEIAELSRYPFMLFEATKRSLLRIGSVPPVARPRVQAFVIT